MLEELKQEFGKPMITVTEAARYLHKDYRTLLGDHRFPYRKIKKRYMVSLVALARYMGD